jgi:uncharacterized membrane protein YgcG
MPSVLTRLAGAAAGAPALLARVARALLTSAPARWRLLAAALGAFLAVETYKGWPLSYHVRLFALLARYRLMPRRLVTLDTPIVSHSQVRLSDIDYHGHLNNGQYALGELAAGVGVTAWRGAVCASTRRQARAHAWRVRPAVHAQRPRASDKPRPRSGCACPPTPLQTPTCKRATRGEFGAVPRRVCPPRSDGSAHRLSPTRPTRPHPPARPTRPHPPHPPPPRPALRRIAAVLMTTGTPYRANASIGTAVFFFLRELRWRARYRIETKCVGIDEKWIYTESRWYVAGGGGARRGRGAAGGGAAAAAAGGGGGGGGARGGAGALPLTAAAAAGDSASSGDAAPRGMRVAPTAAVHGGDVLAAVKLTRFVLKESAGPQRGKTIAPRIAFAELGFAVPESFARAARVGEFFTEAFELAITSSSGAGGGSTPVAATATPGGSGAPGDKPTAAAVAGAAAALVV